ncbi:MAG: hypothetical protein WDA42_02045 [Candidatus Bathyarchaeia archaeon]|jgi:hypothetical protein
MLKILIELSGGLVDSVWCTEKNVDLLIVDHDIDGADEEELACYEELLDTAKEFKKEMVPVY